MKLLYRHIYLLGFVLVLLSCKNESQSPNQDGVDSTDKSVVNPIPKKKVLTEEDKKQISSVMARIMTTPDVKTFMSLLVTTQQSDMLVKQAGPFTIIAPSNEAFSLLDEKKMKLLLNPNNFENLVTLVKSHIVAGNLDSKSIVQNIKDNRGSGIAYMG